ncbi:MAG TPA: hypothetical protein VGI10_00590 [Polyangiaceae bacterium]
MSGEPSSAWPRAGELALLVTVRFAADAVAWLSGFRALSDDDYSRIVIAEHFAQAPSFDPSGTSWLPLPFWVYGGALRVLGTTLDVARITAACLGLLATIALYAAARWLGASRAGALLGAALATLLEYSVLLGVATVPEVPCAALIALGAAALASDDRSRRLLGGAALCAACACRYEAWPVALLFAGFTLRDAVTGRRELVPAALLALCFPLAWLCYGAFHHGSAFFFVTRVTAYRHALGGSAEPWWWRLFAYAWRGIFTPSMLLVIVTLLCTEVPSLKQRALPQRPLLAALALLGFLALGSLSESVPTHHAERALLPIGFLLTLLMGDRILQAWPRARRSLRVGLVVSAGLVSVNGLSAAFDVESNARTDELAIGAQARKSGATSLAIDTPDYGFFAVIAAFADPAHARAIDDRDPRNPTKPDPFASPEALDGYLAAAKPPWLVVTHEHAALVSARCSVRAGNAGFVLARCP